MLHLRPRKTGLALALWVVTAGCAAGSAMHEMADPIDEPDSGGRGGTTHGTGGRMGNAGGSGGPGALGGSPGAGGSAAGGSVTVDAAGSAGGMPGEDAAVPADAAAEDAAPVGSDASTAPVDPASYGKVGELLLIPLQYTAAPVPPLVAAECPEEPTAGFTEYQDSFVVQRPVDLAAADRFSYDQGIYTFFVKSGDKSHKANNSTAPRTEARYSDVSTGQHIWSADVLLDSPLSKTCIQQIHNVVGAIATYLRVVDGRMFNLLTGKTIMSGSYGKWFNLKVSFDTKTRQVKTYVNNCLKETSTAPSGTPYWYFKHGVYTCDSGTCRSHFKNIHLFQKGSTDKFNTKSTYD
jgi:hypothetical protein